MKVTISGIEFEKCACDMKQGEAGVIVSGMYKGDTIFRGYDCLVSLKNGDTWCLDATFSVQLLSRGAEITLEVTS